RDGARAEHLETGLELSTVDTDPILELGAGARVAVSSTGTVFAVSVEESELHTLPSDGSESSTQVMPPLEDVEIAAAGEEPVIFDRSDNRIVRGDGSTVDLPQPGLVLQQSSASDDVALVATGDALMAVPLEGDDDPTVVDASVSAASTEASDVRGRRRAATSRCAVTRRTGRTSSRRRTGPR
ncbi:hypothetical protein, partial [Labedella endophytica]|uniref:hypothetical protein n=1 Tax=Labedella endophytica TaxID=1523160 RepID=UPI0014075C2D